LATVRALPVPPPSLVELPEAECLSVEKIGSSTKAWSLQHRLTQHARSKSRPAQPWPAWYHSHHFTVAIDGAALSVYLSNSMEMW